MILTSRTNTSIEQLQVYNEICTNEFWQEQPMEAAGRFDDDRYFFL